MKSKKNKRGVKRNSRKPSPVVGLIGDIYESSANDFINAIRSEGIPNAKLVTLQLDDVCTDCICRFIKDNKISLLCIDDSVTFNDNSQIEVPDEVIFFANMMDCQIYIVQEVSDDEKSYNSPQGVCI